MSSREQFEAWLSSEYQWANDALNEAHFHGDDATCYYTGGDFIYDGRSCSDALFWAWRGWQESHQQGEAKCAALAAENTGLNSFVDALLSIAWHGGSADGAEIQEIALKHGLLRQEVYSADEHENQVDDPGNFEDGDPVYFRVETPATDAFLAEVRAQGVEAAAQSEQFSMWVQQGLRSFAIGLRQGDWQ
ncbi:hypothetical protein [Leclercia sp. UBA5958]|uniref:hypothetical protein n=1 Tax=Leclercia sp. UBA5958 TaxID=1946742 RepID=UPI00257E0571|nr:hypothetical protein [Leclercia sp. UBA5958]